MTAGGQEVAAVPVFHDVGPIHFSFEACCSKYQVLTCCITGGAGNSYFSLQIYITSNRHNAHCKSEFW